MTEVSIVGPGAGEVAQLGPVRMRILEDGTTTDHRLGLGELTVPPHTDGPHQHRHAQHDEGFYVVSGTARFTVGADSHDAPAGTLVMIPPGAPHTFANPGDEPAVLLNTFTPDLYVQYFRDLRDMFASGRPPTDADLAGVMARYATEPSTEYADTTTSDEQHDRAPGTGVPTEQDPVTGWLRVDDRGSGRPYLLLHGGAGPTSMAGLAALLADAGARALTPTIPGFDGTTRPEHCRTVADLARTYAALLDELDLHDVVVVGNSVGGWIAAELALRATGRVGGVVLVDAVGITVDDHPVTEVAGLVLADVLALSFHDVSRLPSPPATPEARAAHATNAAVFADYAGDPYMHDPGLQARLGGVDVPTLVLWGESDGIVDLDYGRAYAAALDAELLVVRGAGHLPQVEQTATVAGLVRAFAAGAQG